MTSNRNNRTNRKNFVLILAAVALIFLMASVPLTRVSAQGAQAFILNNNAFDGGVPAIYPVTENQSRPWEVIVQPDLEYNTAANQTVLDLFFVSGGHLSGVVGTTKPWSIGNYVCTANAGETCSYSQLRLYLEAGGGLTIYYLQNSTIASSGTNIYVNTNNVMGTGCTSTTCDQNAVYIDYSGTNDSGSGLLNFYAVTPDGQTTTELGNITISGFTFLSYIAGADPNNNATDTTLKPTTSAGFVQVTVQGVPLSVNLSSTVDVVFAIVPLVVVIAVVGWLANYFKSMKF